MSHGTSRRPITTRVRRVGSALGACFVAGVPAERPDEADTETPRNAAAAVAPEVYRRAGATVHAIGCEPDGWNINDGIGSTHLGPLAEAVARTGADLGIAHDGDADRCLAVTADGDEVDGDQVMAILALAMRDAGTLTGDTLVATVMSNLGLRLAMSARGIRLVETKVGDRYVLEELRASGLALGGEQSGHIVMPAYATTGDGLIAGLQFLAALSDSGRRASDLVAQFQPVPQMLKNVRYAQGADPLSAEAVKAEIARAEARLNGQGRVLIRKSGTEPLIRVMAEAEDEHVLREVVDGIVAAVEKAA